ncbi:MAG TPA: glucose-1-phosphate adenylyltransferase [Anaerolineaceae bacterium]|jgi:glucose-1-phosphate adenylyltransferase|nr:glucose-1-phosphate adenylyltransferase [Anaerolineales bacterium]HOG58553.1 glucose-1-phosphate adenylyltransferase [Anaerolineaceae bacterium]HOR83968.1 glucose-1-phosphate adenylyltransferase [Anaerolineaceae bacterium]HOT52517.1 glucose-1-phosphate adenylyltransferase [Anaerolineaceae bacterium]HPL42304.1 glucose-1-phosphate adenylyltransferase [Anaerolineaceae bacterium]
MPKTSEILGVILGGGQGKRLFPLTSERSKPAVPIAGKYRLIDIPISNCINSDIFRIAVLTQFNSVSLHRHISQTYLFDAFHPGWVQIWAAEQTMEHTDWYQGTADAVRKQLMEITSTKCPYVLILAGDHLYRMDYAEMAQFHWDNHADITVAVQPVPKDEAPRFGLLKCAEDGRITDFAEKPKDPEKLASMVSRDDPEKPYLGSMGIYMFNTDLLVNVLRKGGERLDDFGGDIIPHLIGQGASVYGYSFEGYWRDIGTIRSFYETNLELTDDNPGFDFYDPDKPIFTHPRFLPCSRVVGCSLKRVLIAEGCNIEHATVEHSIIGVRSQIGDGSIVRDTIMMGADYYGVLKNGSPLGIGRNCDIQGAIIDKNSSIGDNVVIKPFPPEMEADHALYTVRDGVVVIPKHTTIPAGTVIAP